MLMVSDQDKLRTYDAVLCEAVGGREALEMLARHHCDGVSYRQLAREHGVAPMTIHDRLKRSRQVLARLNLLPSAWASGSNPPPARVAAA